MSRRVCGWSGKPVEDDLRGPTACVGHDTRALGIHRGPDPGTQHTTVFSHKPLMHGMDQLVAEWIGPEARSTGNPAEDHARTGKSPAIGDFRGCCIPIETARGTVYVTIVSQEWQGVLKCGHGASGTAAVLRLILAAESRGTLDDHSGGCIRVPASKGVRVFAAPTSDRPPIPDEAPSIAVADIMVRRFILFSR
jgi:hypothetical protein